MRSVESKDKDRQIDQTVQSKIEVNEEHDQELDEIANLKTEYDPMKIASIENETTGKSWEYTKWQCYHSHLKTLLKTDPVLKILRPKLIGPLDKPISVPPPGTNKLDAISLILRMLDDMGFCANAFDGDDLLSFSLEQLQDARSKFV